MTTAIITHAYLVRALNTAPKQSGLCSLKQVHQCHLKDVCFVS